MAGRVVLEAQTLQTALVELAGETAEMTRRGVTPLQDQHQYTSLSIRPGLLEGP